MIHHPSYDAAAAFEASAGVGVSVRFSPALALLAVQRADTEINSGGGEGTAPECWLDARDYQGGDGTVETPAMRAATATQPTSSKRPTFDRDGFGDGGPCFTFDGSDDVWACGTSIELSGTACAMYATCSATDTGTTGEIWEYTTGATLGVNGAYIAFRVDGGDYHPFVVVGGAADYAGSYLAGDYEGVEGCLSSVVDRNESTELAQCGGKWNGVAFDVENGTDPIAGGNFAAGQSSWIGARNNGSALPFGGSLRELVIFDTSHTAAQRLAVETALLCKSRLGQ